MNKTILAALCLTIGLLSFGCKNNEIPKAVADHFDLLNSHDLEKIAAQYTNDAKISSTGFDDVRVGPIQVKIIYNRYFNSSPDLQYKITKVIYADSAATVEYTSTGSIPAEDYTSPMYMRGKKYTLRNCAVLHFKDGKITSEATYFDQNTFLHQIGYFDQPCDKRN